MPRCQLVELQDLPWCPRFIRDALTDMLHSATVRLDVYGPVVPKLKAALKELDCREIIDLCSGGSGPARLISDKLAKEMDYAVGITLTDLYPNIPAFREAAVGADGAISFIEYPVDAGDVPEHLHGFRTLFSSFHHFDPDSARNILRDAAEKREGIGIFEVNGRDLFAIVLSLGTPFAVMAVMPFMEPRTWKRLFWTYAIPAIPLIAAWDGLVSNLRSYSTEELRELVSGIEVDGYAWEIGRMRGRWRRHVTYLLGYPVDDRASSASR